MVNEGDFVVRQRPQKIDGLVEKERRNRRTREAQAVEGIGDFGVEARWGAEVRIACSTTIEESTALHTEWAINKPAHNDGGVDDKGRRRHSGYMSLYPPASRAVISSSTGSGSCERSTPR